MNQESVIKKCARERNLKPLSRDIKAMGWEHSKDGLTISQVRVLIADEANRQRKIRVSRAGGGYLKSAWYSRRILIMQHARDAARGIWKRMLLSPDYHRVGVNLYRKDNDLDVDYNYYARSYGHPKITVLNRRVEELSFSLVGGFRVTNSVEVPRFAGDFMLKAIAKMRNVTVPHKKGIENRVQMKPYFNIRKLKTTHGFDLWERTFCGEHHDYCVVRDGFTFHAHTIREAFVGVNEKILKRYLKKAGGLITKETALELGFCNEGIQDFCDVNGLEVMGEITKKDLQMLVDSNREANLPFVYELRQMGISI